MQAFPNKPIRILTNRAGDHIAIVASLIAQGISGPLGQPVIIDNRGTGVIQGESFVKEPPDGYALLGTGSQFWTTPLIENAPYDVVRDFSPITLLGVSPLLVVVHPSVAANTLDEFLALAKARPGQFTYGSGRNGSSSQLAGALLTRMAGIDLVQIHFKGGGFLGVEELVAGKVHLMMPSAGAAMQHVKSGRLRALAVTSAERSALAPGVPTVAATLAGYEMVQRLAIFAAAATPETVVQRLNQEIVRFLKTTQAKGKLLDLAVEAVGSSPEELAAIVKSEMTKWREVIRDAGIEK